MERITSAQPPPCMDLPNMHSMDFPLYVYKSRRGVKRGDDSKETYKLPHRLIEKKRRDRINECIAQLKDLLPEHLKLTTLGHLEKAVVLELTLKHVKALTNLLEQQQKKIVALQSGMQIGEPSPTSLESSEEIFRSGFHLCAKEVLQFLANQESGRDVNPSHVISHLQKVAAELVHGAPVPQGEEPARTSSSVGAESRGKNCVPVIQRTSAPGVAGEQSGSDTDTDSGYGGELDKQESTARREQLIKREADEEPRPKRPRAESPGDESLSCGELMSSQSGYMGFPSQQPPFCLPFYLIPPAAAAYLPMLEKCWYPGGMPVLYPGMGMPSEKLASSLGMSPRVGSPVTPQTMDSPTLLQALKQIPPLNIETKE